jgi:small Trp-rich protein
MPFVCAGLLLITLYGLDVSLVDDLSWGWVLAPFACALVWYELVEPQFRAIRGAKFRRQAARALRARGEAALAALRFWRRTSGATADES